MQKWWLIGAGVVGVGLAVVLLGRPLDTGEDVDPMGEVDVVLSENGERAQPGDLIGRVQTPGADVDGVPSPSVIPGDRPRNTTMVRPGSQPIDRSKMVSGPNPMALRAARRRDTPEARLSARITAPWTQVRREMAKAAGDDPNASALIGDVQAHLEDLKLTQRDPQSVDFEDIARHQDDLMRRVKESPFYNGEMERMLAMVDERTQSYKKGGD